MSRVPEVSEGAHRAAVLLLTIGEDAAAEVLRHMGPKEVQSVGAAMASLKNVTRTDVRAVLEEFSRAVENETALGVGSDDYIRNMLVNALGADKANSLIDRILLGRNTKGLEALKWMDARAIADIVQQEHPQIMAIVISHLDPDHAADVLSCLPERVRSDVLLRIATLDGIQPSALQELDEILEKQFSGNSAVKSSSVGGVKSAADILNFMDSAVEEKLLEQVNEIDAATGERIQELMFVFDNLVDVDNQGIQTLLREVATDTLVVALKGAGDTIKDKFFNNMSKRAAEMLREDLEAKGPVRLSDVEAAQKEILATARRLSEAGEIVLSGPGSEEFV